MGAGNTHLVSEEGVSDVEGTLYMHLVMVAAGPLREKGVGRLRFTKRCEEEKRKGAEEREDSQNRRRSDWGKKSK